MKKCNCEICQNHKEMSKEWIEESFKKANRLHQGKSQFTHK